MSRSIVLILAFIAAPAFAQKADTDACNVMAKCTKEYMPSVCSQGGVYVEGANKCRAREKLRAQLCNAGKDFVAEKVSCVATKTVTVESLNCESPRFCTMDYNPANCFYQGKKYRGSNSCSAQGKVEAEACTQGLANQKISIQCAPIGKIPKKPAFPQLKILK